LVSVSMISVAHRCRRSGRNRVEHPSSRQLYLTPSGILDGMSNQLGRHALTLWTQIKDPDELRDKLVELHDEKIDIDNAITHAVAQGRRLGLSWDQIGAELLMSKQSAWQRWTHLDREASAGERLSGGG